MEWALIALAVVAFALLVRERLVSGDSDDPLLILAKTAPVSIVVFDEETILDATDRVVSLVGGPDIGAVIGQPLDAVLTDETKKAAQAAFRQVMRTGEQLEIADLMVASRNGARVLCDVTMVPIRVDGKPAAHCALLPVADRHKAMQDLAATEERFRQFFDDTPVPMYRTRVDGTIVHANRASARLLGLDDPSNLIGRNAAEFYVDPYEREEVVSARVDTGVNADRLVLLKRADGRELWVQDSSRTIVDDGSVVYEGVLIDLTQEQRYNDEVQLRAVQQQALAEIARVALREADAGRVLSDAAKRVCEVIGTDCTLIAQEHADRGLVTTSVAYGVESIAARETILRHLQAEVVSPSPNSDAHRLPVKMDSQLGPIEGVSLALRGSSEVYGVIATAGRGFSPTQQDMDFLGTLAATLGSAIERARSRAYLSRLIRSKDEFVASVSHELRTPLTVVAGLALELNRGWQGFSEEEIAEFIDLIADQSREMGDLIEDLLVAARADIGKVAIHHERIDVRDCVDKVVASCPATDRDRVEVAGNGVAGWADPVRCRQIVRNLVTNAIRYGGERISVTVAESDGKALISVFDNGVGIPTADREKVFAPYERAHTEIGVVGSVGLGLTVARQLTEMMDGSINYRYDAGSYFEVRLPMADTRI